MVSLAVPLAEAGLHKKSYNHGFSFLLFFFFFFFLQDYDGKADPPMREVRKWRMFQTETESYVYYKNINYSWHNAFAF